MIFLGLVLAVMPWARQADRCWLSFPPFLRLSPDFFTVLEVELAEKALDWLPKPANHATAFFGPPGGTNLGILGDGGPPDDTRRESTNDG